MTTAVVFDLDGTLIHSAPDIHSSLQAVLAREGIGTTTFAQSQSFIGRGVPALIAQAVEACGRIPNPDLVQRMAVHFHALYEHSYEQTHSYPSVQDCLHALAGQGHQLGLCTNKPERPTHAVLAHFGRRDLFAAMSFGDGPYKRKPDPAPLRFVVNGLGAKRVLYVGDSETDAATAAAAGIDMALFTEGYRKTPVAELPHRYAFNSFADLPGIAERFFA